MQPDNYFEKYNLKQTKTTTPKHTHTHTRVVRSLTSHAVRTRVPASLFVLADLHTERKRVAKLRNKPLVRTTTARCRARNENKMTWRWKDTCNETTKTYTKNININKKTMKLIIYI